jgi:anti-sigma B factor antagonist
VEITVDKEGRASIINMRGNFDMASSEPFDKQITTLIASGETRILLDFSNVSFIASTGLRMLLKTAQRVKDEGGLLYVSSINEAVQQVFAMTGLDTILSIFETREQALVDLV